MAAGFGYRARGSALGLAALTFALSSPVRAAAADIPPECGTRAAFDAVLSERLGSGAAVDAVQLRLEPRDERFHLRVQIGNDVRELDDPSCRELMRAAVVVALAMLMRDQPQPAVEPAPAPRAEPAPAPRAEPAPAPRAEPAPAAPPRSARPTYPLLAIAAGAGVVAGSLPKPVLGLELESKLLWQRFGVAFDLRYLSSAEERDAADKGVQIQGFGFGALGVFRPAARWEARLGLSAQRLSGIGRGRIAERREDVSWSLGPTLGLGFLVVEARPFWLGLGAEGQFNALTARFQIRNYSQEISDDPQNMFVSPWLSASGFVRFGLVF